MATNPALNLFVADPKAVLTDDDLAAVIANTHARGRSLADVGVAPRSTAIAALATAADSRIAVLTGDPGKFAELSALMPGSTPQGEAPAAVASLIDALEQAVRGSAPPLPGSELLE